MNRRLRSALLATTYALLCTGAPVAAQQVTGFDLSTLHIPDGFLDLDSVVLATGSQGDMVATGTTILGTAKANVLLALDRTAGIKNGLTLAIKPRSWSLTKAIPALSNPVLDNLDFSHVALVLSSAARDESSAALSDPEWYFYRDVYQQDNFTLTLQPGVNLIAAIPADKLGPDNPLNLVMNALGIQKGVILLQGNLGKSLSLLGGGGAPKLDAIKDMYLRAELPPMRPPGSPQWFRGGQLALELTGQPSVRLVGDMKLDIDDALLDFFVATSLSRTGMALTGGLVAKNGWQQPFGIPWLVLKSVVLQLAIVPTGIQPGFAASMVIGKKDINVAIALVISPAGVPTNVMFKGQSAAGLALADLVELQSQMAAARNAVATAAGAPDEKAPTIPLDALPDIAFRDLKLSFASKDNPDLGIQAGFQIAGQMWLPLSADGQLTDFAGVDVGVTKQGIWARGNLGTFDLGPLTWHDAKLDLTATPDTQRLIVKGAVDMFGSSAMVDLKMTRQRFSLKSTTNLFNSFTADLTASSVFNLRKPSFQVHGVAHADFGDMVGPMAQDAMAQFAETGADVVAAAQQADEAAQQVLANAQATADDLRHVLEAQRQKAQQAVAVADRAAAQARRALNAAWAAQNRAYRVWRNTSRWRAGLKAARRAAYARARVNYVRHAVAYNARMAVVAATRRLVSDIPPVDQNVLMLKADAKLAALRDRVQTMHEKLTRTQTELNAIKTALANGEQLLVIDKAEFDSNLQAAMNGQAMQWSITGRFAGTPFQIHRSIDFSNPGQGVADMVQAILGQ
jgi:hypothetical protein